MKPRERVLTALRCEEPDQVPFLESVVDEPVALALLGRPQPADQIQGELGTGDQPVFRGTLLGSERYEPLALVEELGLDGFGTYLFLRHQGIQEQVDGHYMVHGGAIKSRADLARIDLPDPDDPALYEPYREFIERYRDTDRALFCFLNLGSDPVILGMGFETFALALYDDPMLVETLFEIYTSWYAQAVVHLCELDFDFLWFGDDIAFKTGPYVSPKTFHELFLPHYRRVVEQITKPWIFHSDGNLVPILDDLLSLGMDGLHPIEPEAMDLGELKRRYDGELCLVGHISVDTLSRGTPQEVENLVRDAIRTAGPGGGYIAGSSNSIPYYARPENVRAMQRAIRIYGRYPVGG
ncbi:MAG: uroporphyrinogen decarboxylase family protein [Anaerolineae bacterium]